MDEDLKKEYMRYLEENNILFDAENLTGYLTDASFLTMGRPGLGIFPRNEDDIIKIVDFAVKHKVPLTPRGAASGTAGAALCPPSGAMVFLDRIGITDELGIRHISPQFRIYDKDGNEVSIDEAPKIGWDRELYVRVGAGATTDELNVYLKPKGLEVVVVPSSGWSTVGGNFSTNAGGSGTPKYGVFGQIVNRIRNVISTKEGAKVETITDRELITKMGGGQGLFGIVTELDIRIAPLPDPSDLLAAVTWSEDESYEALGTRVGLFMEEMQEKCNFTAGEFMLVDSTIISPDDPIRKNPELQDFFVFSGNEKRMIVLYKGLRKEMKRFEEVIGAHPGISWKEISVSDFDKMMVVRKSATGKAAGRVAVPGFEDIFVTEPSMMGKVLDIIFSRTEGVIPGRPIGHQYSGGMVIHFRPQGHVTKEGLQEAWDVAMALCNEVIKPEMHTEKRREHGLGVETGKLTKPKRLTEIKQLKARFDPANIFNPWLLEPEPKGEYIAQMVPSGNKEGTSN